MNITEQLSSSSGAGCISSSLIDHTACEHQTNDPVPPSSRRLNICMVSDFFFPCLGGVELHIYSLAAELIKLGHKVIVITHWKKPRRHGVRYMTAGVKVYCLPLTQIYDVVTLPSGYNTLPLLRCILIREKIDIVHGHTATSTMAMECLWHARTMGIHTIYTDHSLFGFERRGEIHVNGLLKVYLADIDFAVCVSHTDRENFVIRAGLVPNNVFVIPNAMDPSLFTPDVSHRPSSLRVNIIVVSRLAYRKGIDILVELIPRVCQALPHVNFIIGGDGPKRLCLEEMREAYKLESRVELLGEVPHKDVPNVLRRGHIFLNASLTEAFCIAIVEAASCGLLVVATNVGGVPEVLPAQMLKLAEPNVDALTEAVIDAVKHFDDHQVDPHAFHKQVAAMYSWADVARRTLKVYRLSMERSPISFTQRLLRKHSAGRVWGKMFVLFTTLNYVLLRFLEWIYPRSEIEIAPEWDRSCLRQKKKL